MKRLLAALAVAILPVLAHAIEPFVVKDIRVEGIQRIAAGTVFNYLPIKIGDKVTDKTAQEAIRALYQTGFFRDVRLEQQDDVLIVQVVERPSIASLRLSGVKAFPEDELKKSIRSIGLSEGRIFNRSLLDRMEQDLRAQYFSRGYYAVSIKPTVTPLERNRVALDIAVVEGPPAKIHEVVIVGNRQFSDKELLKLFNQGPVPWWAVFSDNDQYSKQVLAGDLERLRNFYQDRGYLDFNIDSTQVSITPDKERIHVTVNITEGETYTVSQIRLSGKFPVAESELRSLLTLRSGDPFSRRAVTESQKRIADRLANDGFAFANVNPVPDVDKENRTVAFTFSVDPGHRVYVRRINFAGNAETHDEVLRREMRQLEGAWYSAEKVRRSRERLVRLGFFDDVTVETPQVPGTVDQVDVNVTVKERASGNIMLGVGYGSEGGLFNASISETNLFGTGKELSFNFDNTQASTNFNLRYVNPYHTPDGVSRGFSLFSRSVQADELDAAAYDTKTIGAGVFYGIPLSEFHRLTVGLDLENIKITTKETSAQSAKEFVEGENGSASGGVGTAEVALAKLTLGWSNDSLNDALFPTSGGLQRLSGEMSVPASDIEYYKITYLAARYFPIGERSTFRLRGELGYGDGYRDTDRLPFFKNYYAGGSTTVRGYRSNALGPRDPTAENRSIGGNRRVLGNAELLFPAPTADPDNRSVRLSWFVDAGMVYGHGEDFDLGQLRYSTGLAFNWFSPVGPISFSYSFPLNEKPGDRTESFQFTLGVPFR
jgi:outer membrane protein insertion porin family